jgi:uncharacterized protein (UPF0210 family)
MTDNQLQLIDRLQAEVMQDLRKWQLSYHERGDKSAVERIERHLQTLSTVCNALLLSVSQEGLKRAKIHRMQCRFDEYQDAAEKQIKELEEVIKTESYFMTRTKNNR